MLRRLTETGDTIIEVLIAIVVVSFVLTAAYVTANKNTLINQETQERSQALQLANSQLEFLHTTSLGTHNCFTAAGVAVDAVAGSNNPCTVNADGSTDTADTLPEYTIAITHPSTTYTVTISWARLTNNASQASVVLYYQP